MGYNAENREILHFDELNKKANYLLKDVRLDTVDVQRIHKITWK